MSAGTDPVPIANSDEMQLGRLGDFVGFRLRRIQNQLSREFAAVTAEHDLRAGLFSALAVVSANPGLSQVALAREVGLDKSLTVAVVDDLEARGLAERRRSPTDRRRHALYVTAEGEALLDTLFDRLEAVERDVLNTLGPRDLHVLNTLLDRIYKAAFRG